MTPQRPFTPATLAERWECSAETIRTMCKDGRLPAFRAGDKMFRIRVEAVEEYEKCQASQSAAYAVDTAAPGMMPMDGGGAINLRHSRERKRKQKP